MRAGLATISKYLGWCWLGLWLVGLFGRVVCNTLGAGFEYLPVTDFAVVLSAVLPCVCPLLVDSFWPCIGFAAQLLSEFLFAAVLLAHLPCLWRWFTNCFLSSFSL
jgi:hypothetical protein